MSRALRPEDAWHLCLEGSGPQGAASDLMATVALLRSIGSEIQAPPGLRARRGRLVATGRWASSAARPAARWRHARATLLAAVLTALMAAAVGAVTFGTGWLRAPDSEERPRIPLVVPLREPADEPEAEDSPPSPAETYSELDEEKADAEMPNDHAPGHDATEDEAIELEEDLTEPDDEALGHTTDLDVEDGERED